MMETPQAGIAGIESEWVKLCPYLQVRAPHPLVADSDPSTKDVREIYDYFRSEDEKEPLGAFLRHFNQLSTIPGPGETKIAQVLMSIRLKKMVRQAKLTGKQAEDTLKKLGVKL